MKNDQISIRVYIADRPYKINTSTQEEEGVRKAVKRISDKMTELKGSYQAKDVFDYLAMASLLLCTELIKKEETGGITDDEVAHQITRLETLLEDVSSSSE